RLNNGGFFMKKIASLFLAILMLFAGIVPAYAIDFPAPQESQGTVSPQYAYISALISALEINSSGKAVCAGAVILTSNNNSVELTVTLQKKSGSAWSAVKSWTEWGEGKDGVTMENSYYVISGTYRVAVTAKVYNSSGTLVETQTQYSKQVTY
ncbi:MAG TPA: hypothetical protein VN369_06475, partial [Terriglobales bacterium]|nr:hypothetical protein [Terriglobales bacterium]